VDLTDEHVSTEVPKIFDTASMDTISYIIAHMASTTLSATVPSSSAYGYAAKRLWAQDATNSDHMENRCGIPLDLCNSVAGRYSEGNGTRVRESPHIVKAAICRFLSRQCIGCSLQ